MCSRLDRIWLKTLQIMFSDQVLPRTDRSTRLTAHKLSACYLYNKKNSINTYLAWGRRRGNSCSQASSVLKKLVFTVTLACSAKGAVESICQSTEINKYAAVCALLDNKQRSNQEHRDDAAPFPIKDNCLQCLNLSLSLNHSLHFHALVCGIFLNLSSGFLSGYSCSLPSFIC